jgi:hypothetical protein
VFQIGYSGETPIGTVDFNNLIYTFDPAAPRKIVLAAHFDSKWFPDYPANQVSSCSVSMSDVGDICKSDTALFPACPIPLHPTRNRSQASMINERPIIATPRATIRICPF